MSRLRVTHPSITEPSDGRVGSHCLRCGDLVFISGQVSRWNGKIVAADDPLGQCRQVLRNIRAIVEAAGGKIDDVVSLNIFLRDISYREHIIKARAEVFADPGPTATVVGGVQLALPEWLVEISAIARLS